MERTFNLKHLPSFTVRSDNNMLTLMQTSKSSQNKTISKVNINEKGLYKDEFVSFPASKIIEKNTPHGRCTIVFGDMATYGTSQPNRYIKIEENGYKIALKKGRNNSNSIFRAYGDILNSVGSGKFSTTAQKYIDELKNINLATLTKIIR
ncbi:hypothetical protein IJZ97_05875 [bacterium]|nr:hypothetical protein [bacterium]